MKHIFLSLLIFFALQVYSESPVNGSGEPNAKSEMNANASLVFSGSVIDSETGEKLAGARIVIEETGISTFTDMNGGFSIKQLTPGTYTMKVSYISYEEKQMASQIISDGQQMSISLKPL
jgi:hypothetical protein